MKPSLISLKVVLTVPVMKYTLIPRFLVIFGALERPSSLLLLAKKRPKRARVEAAHGNGPSNDVSQGHREQIGQKELRPCHTGAERHAERNQKP